MVSNSKLKGEENRRQQRHTDQKADGALFQIQSVLLIPRVARCQLRLEDKLPKLLLIYVPVLIQTLWLRVLVIHHLPPPTYSVSH